MGTKILGPETAPWVEFPEKRVTRSDLIKTNGIGVLLDNKMAHKNQNKGIPVLSDYFFD